MITEYVLNTCLFFDVFSHILYSPLMEHKIRVSINSLTIIL